MALEALRGDPEVTCVGLLTDVTEEYARVSIHGISRDVLCAQAIAIGPPLVEVTLRVGADNATNERAWITGVERVHVRVGPVDAVAYGDLFLADARAYRDAVAVRLGVPALFPLRGRDTAELAAYFTSRGFQADVCCADTRIASAEWAGRRYDDALVAAMPEGVDPSGERGEFHTCVTAGPIFAAPLLLTVGARMRRDGRFEYCDLMFEEHSRDV
jgi:diphthamide synthase (EF-2-diphthine--ammonia ligase)